MSLRSVRVEKITPRWPARADSKIRFAALMEAVEALLANHTPSDITIQMIAERAGMPTATVYHFFPSAEAALFAQARIYIERFQVSAERAVEPHERTTWPADWRLGLQRGREMYTSNVACMRLLLGPDVPRDIQAFDADANIRHGELIAGVLREFYVMPNLPDLAKVCTNAVEINDTFWRLSVQRHGTITDEMAEEGARAILAYVGTYIAADLPLRKKR